MKNLNERELACVRAALTFWRREGAGTAGVERDIASGDGTFDELSAEEIRSLIDELGEDEPPLMYVDMADQLDEIVQCFSRNGEFNTHSARLGTVEIREAAVKLRDAIQALSNGEAILSVMMQDVIGNYDEPTGPEWKWVETNASYAHQRNGEDGVWEFVLNLSRTFEHIPRKLGKTIEKARGAGFGYLLFHQGT
jgi:hypothetical protein